MQPKYAFSGKAFTQSTSSLFPQQGKNYDSLNNIKDFPNDYRRQASDCTLYKPTDNMIESIKNDLYEYSKSIIYSMSGDLIGLKKDIQNNNLSIEAISKQIDYLNNSISLVKNSNTSDILMLKDSINQIKDNDRVLIDELMRINMERIDKKFDELESGIKIINDKIRNINNNIQYETSHIQSSCSYMTNNNFDDNNNILKGNKKYMTIDHANQFLLDIITEVEKKLAYINDNIKNQLKIMDMNFSDIIKQKDMEFLRLEKVIKTLENNKINQNKDNNLLYSDSIEHKIYDSIKKPSIASTRELSNSLSEFRPQKLNLNDEVNSSTSILIQSIEIKLKEIESTLANLALTDKELKSKYDFCELNLNSIKRNMEIELNIAIKQVMVPLQQNVEEYIKSADTRIGHLEDVILQQIKKDTMILSIEKANKLRHSSFNKNIKDLININNNEDDQGLVNYDNNQNNDRYSPSIHDDKVIQGLDQAFINTHTSLNIHEESPMTLLHQNTYNTVSQTMKPEVDSENPINIMIKPNPMPNLQASDRVMESSKAQSNLIKQQIKKDKELLIKSKTTKSNNKYVNKLAEDLLEVDNSPPSSKAKVNNNSKTNTNTQNPSLNKPAPNTKIDPIKAEEKKPSNSKNIPIIENPPSSFNIQEEEEDYQGNLKGLLRKSRSKKENNNNQALKDSKKIDKPIKSSTNSNNIESSQSKNKSTLTNPNVSPIKLEDSNLPPLDPNPKMKNSKGNLPALKDKDPKVSDKLNQIIGQDTSEDLKSSINDKNRFNSISESQYSKVNSEEYILENTEDNEQIEEIVYNVNEDGFVVDENGNFIVDEQGNFLKLSPEQMNEIENNDIIYEDQEY